VDVDAFNHSGLARVGGGNHQVSDAGGPGGHGDGQHSLHRPQAAVEAQLADQQEVGDVLDVERAVGSENSDGDGQIEAGASLLDVGRGQVDGDAGGRNVEAGVLDGGAHAVAGLADGGVGQADGVELLFVGLDAGEVDLDVDDAGVDAVDGGAAGFEEHRRPELSGLADD